MKRLILSLTVSLILAIGFVPASYGQATTTLDRLSVAVGAGINPPAFITVVTGTQSAAAFAVGNFVFIDQEAMQITSLPASGRRFGVARGQQGTFAQAHAASAAVYVGPANRFIRTDKSGTCTAGNEIALPQINTSNGKIYDCSTNGLWVTNNYTMGTTYANVTIINNADYTAQLFDEVIVMRGLSEGRTITLPSITNMPGHTLVVVNDGTETSTVTLTAVNGQNFASNATLSTTFSGAGSSVRLMSTSIGWFTW